MKIDISAPAGKPEITITRLLRAPRQLVFDAWTRPEHITRWFGRKDSTMPVCEVDLRPGGGWRYVTRMADGSEHPFKGVYREIAPPDRIVYTECYDVEPWNTLEAVVTVTLTKEEGGMTRLTSHSVYPSLEARDGHLNSGMEEGANESMERLDAVLAGQIAVGDTSDREIGITRIFRAPRELVFRMWTDPDHVGQWWGPKGFTTTIHSMDVRVGGEWRYTMHGPDGTDWPNLIVYSEIVPPERLVYSHGDFENPAMFHVVVLFEDLGDRTQVTKRLTFPTAEERNQVVEKNGALEGLNQHMDGLMDYLAKMV